MRIFNKKTKSVALAFVLHVLHAKSFIFSVLNDTLHSVLNSCDMTRSAKRIIILATEEVKQESLLKVT